MSDALDLSRLRALAQQAKDESPNERWYEPMQIEIRLGGDGDFISAVTPDVILHLVQLAAETQQIREERDALRQRLASLEDDLQRCCEVRNQKSATIVNQYDEIKSLRQKPRAEQAEAEAQALREAVHTVVRGFDEGVFVRSIDGDADPAWAIKLMPFIQALAALQRLTPASPRTGETAKTGQA